MEKNLADAQQQLSSSQQKVQELESEDQRVKNKELQDEIDNIKKTYQAAQKSYERLTDLIEGSGKAATLSAQFAKVLNLLSTGNYTSASATLKTLDALVTAETAKRSTAGIVATVPVNNAAPGSGYSRQRVQTSSGEYIVDIVAADLSSTKVIIDTASDGNCADNCPVLPLATYVARSGAFAGINGTYFCPESYPSCAGKKNAFDLLVMNKNKTYFNSDNNVYSTNPAAIFSAGSARFVSRALEWGRDTSVDGVISNFPLLLLNGQIQVGGVTDAKMTGRGSRSFVGAKGSTAYIGVVRSATVEEVALVLKTMGLDHAMNLDSGGSTALWSGGYKAGPGRNIPNAVLFVRR